MHRMTSASTTAGLLQLNLVYDSCNNRRRRAELQNVFCLCDAMSAAAAAPLAFTVAAVGPRQPLSARSEALAQVGGKDVLSQRPRPSGAS